MSNTNLPTAADSLRILKEAVELAQSRGVYSIPDCVYIATALQVLGEIHPMENADDKKPQSTGKEGPK
jgi:hypothetical protein